MRDVNETKTEMCIIVCDQMSYLFIALYDKNRWFLLLSSSFFFILFVWCLSVVFCCVNIKCPGRGVCFVLYPCVVDPIHFISIGSLFYEYYVVLCGVCASPSHLSERINVYSISIICSSIASYHLHHTSSAYSFHIPFSLRLFTNRATTSPMSHLLAF